MGVRPRAPHSLAAGHPTNGSAPVPAPSSGFAHSCSVPQDQDEEERGKGMLWVRAPTPE